MNFKKLTAFTLAETLIVMGVIGVVATLTIPSLTNSTNSKDTVAKVRKAHSNLEDAFGRMIAEYGEMSEWSETLASNNLGDRLVSSMKLTKNCKVQTTGNCFSPSSNIYNSTATIAENVHTNGTVYKALLASGFSVGLLVDNATCTKDVTSNNAMAPQDLKQVCGVALVDVDGPGKGKHKHGTDLFQFYLTRHGFYPVGFDGDTTFKYVDNCTVTGSNVTVDSQACTAWIINNGNLDYKKTTTEGKCVANANKKLDFATNTSCD